MRRLLLTIVVMISVYGCGIHVIETVSAIDQSKTIQHERYIYPSNMRLVYQLYWNNQIPKNSVALNIRAPGGIKIAKGTSLDIFIDGQKDSFNQYFYDRNSSTAENRFFDEVQYIIDKKILDRMITGGNVGIRLNQANNIPIEDIIVDKRYLIEFKEYFDKL